MLSGEVFSSMALEVQGHRGARGLKPENTLPGFEAALDAGVTSIETDVHLTADDVPVLIHDPTINAAHFQLGTDVPERCIRGVTLAELQKHCADRNPDSSRFPRQTAAVTALAKSFADLRGLPVYSPPSVSDLFAFAAAYADALGAAAGKTELQRHRAKHVRFDLELKRVPFRPELIGDGFDGADAGILERHLVAAVRAAGVETRTTVRSFDHRCVTAIRRLEPKLTGAVLITETRPVSPVELVRQADAQVYCPSFEFVDEELVRQLHAEGIRVLPWTVNELADWERLVDLGVDGICTDHPDLLVAWLCQQKISF